MLSHIDRSGGRRVYEFPGARELGPQRELSTGPILDVTPAAAEPWVGVFTAGSYGVAAPATLIAWPDRLSFCVVQGNAVVVRADDPQLTYEIDVYYVAGTFVVPERELVVFADHTSLTAYDADGLVWRSRRLALDDVRIRGVEGDDLIVSGFFGTEKALFRVDLATGRASGQPFDPE